jgi:Leucine-rich repeat (LRR) protein
MKKALQFILTLVISTITCNLSAQIIDIPDANFKNALIAAGVDKNGDGEIQESEAESVKKIAVNRKNISSLEGIEKFINLEDLECYNNKLTNLNLQNLTKLTSITASSNSLLSINLSNSNSLKRISIGENQLTNFNLDNLTNLELLHIRNNPLDALDLSRTPKLKSLDCLGINVTNFDFSYTPLLDSLVFGMADITQLDVSSLTNTSLKTFTTI